MSASITSNILLVDCYDSFTYNLVHALEGHHDYDVCVARVDELSVKQINNFEFIIFSPGPGLPAESKNLLNLVQAAMSTKKKVLGVCLGMQAMAVATGGQLRNLHQVHHGVSREINIEITTSLLFHSLPEKIYVGRYHSWIVDEGSLSPHWQITARDTDGQAMAMQHISLPFHGIQFHPESVLTPFGNEILQNFLKR